MLHDETSQVLFQMNFWFVRRTNDLKKCNGFAEFSRLCFGPAPCDQHPRTHFSVFGRALERSYILILSAFRDSDSVDGANELSQIVCFDWLTNKPIK